MRRSGLVGPVLLAVACALLAAACTISPAPEPPHRVDVLVRQGPSGPVIEDLSVTPHLDAPLAESAPGADGASPDMGFLTLHDADGKTLYRAPAASGLPARSFSHRAHASDPHALQSDEPAEAPLHVVSLPLILGATHLGVNGVPQIELLHAGDGECPPCVGLPERLFPATERASEEVLDIVILGDGFHRDENDYFRDRARLLADTLLATEPYKRNADRIQIHMIPTVSKDSGVDDPLSGTQKDTCLDLTGGQGGCCGTDSPKMLWKALGCRFPVRQVDLRIVIANVPVYGGRGHSDVRAAYINAYSKGKEDKFAAVAMHEIGHALAGLADEYAGCEPVDGPRELFANMATREQVDTGTVPWLDLAKPDELADPQHFRFVYEVPASQGDVCHSGMPKIPDEYDGKLGLFWGAMYVDGDTSTCPGGCNVWGDPRGANYFRPMAHCKMRYVFDDFCRVCDRELERAILRYVGDGTGGATPGVSAPAG